MVNQIKIRKTPEDTELLYRSLEFEVNNNRVITPLKTTNLNTLSYSNEFLKYSDKLNEIYKTIDPKSLKKIISDNLMMNNFNQQINRVRLGQDQINIFYLEYKNSEKQIFPSKIELQFLCDTIYSHSDIVALPILRDIHNLINNDVIFNNFLKYIKETLEVIDSLNGKPVMAIIPPIPYIYIKDLTDFLIKQEINAFAFDFRMRSINNQLQNLISFYRTLYEMDSLDNSLIKVINYYRGRFLKEKDKVPAKDILTLGFGIDILGDIHLGSGGSGENGKKKEILNKKTIPDLLKRPLRLFIKEDYSYQRTSNFRELEKLYPNDSRMPINIFNTQNQNKFKIFQKILNFEQLNLETINLKNIISQNLSMKSYLDTKSFVKPEDKKLIIDSADIIKTPKNIQQKLNGFF